MAINKIKSTSIEDDAITSAKVADGVISAADVADGTLTSAKLSYPLTTFSSTGIDDNATSTAITITSSEFVGINTTSPQRYLHITGNDGASGTNAGNSDTQVFIDNDGGNGAMIEFGASNTGAGRIMFSDVDSTNQGQIEYFHSTDHMEFSTNKSEAMRIDSSGHAIIPAGVTLGTSAGTYNASNTLDDYEEGTWSPTIIVDGVARTTVLVNNNKYRKVGGLVTISCMIRAQGGTTTGAVTIGGTLPFTPEHGFTIRPSNRALDFDGDAHLKVNASDTTIYTRLYYDQDYTDTNNEVSTTDTRSIKVLEFSATYHTTA